MQVLCSLLQMLLLLLLSINKKYRLSAASAQSRCN
jgi:hypothetical protein